MKTISLFQAFLAAVVVALCANSTQGAALATYYPDTDYDGWGNSLQPMQVAGMPPAGRVVIGWDVNDFNAAIHRGALDIVDGIDNNLNGYADETNSVLGPIITYPNPTLFTVTVGQLLSVPVTVQSDVQGEPVGFQPFYTIPPGSSFAAGPAGAICNGTFQWTPTIADLGWYTAVFPAGYSAGASVVGDSDAGIVIQVVPEPAALSLLALSGLAMLRRRRCGKEP